MNLESIATRPVKIAYDIIMAFMAVYIIVSLFWQGYNDVSEQTISLLQKLDYYIWLVFVADYCIRLIVATDKRQFIRTNIIDLLSILPFDMFFQGLRAVRVVRLLYMFRVFVYLNRVYKRLTSILTANDFHHVLWFTFSTIFIGAIAISFIEDMNIGDALWWSFVTTTTVGYGDIAPQSVGGRIVAVFLMIIGIGFLSTLTGTVSSFFIQSYHVKSSYKEEAVNQVIKKLNNFSSLSVEDIDDIHKVLLALKKSQNP